jgi:hypothetical protein
LTAIAALEDVADAAPPDPEAVAEADPLPDALAEEAVAEAPPAPPALPLALLDAVAEAEAEDELERPELALAEPQTTDWQAVMPVRSFGCASTQSAFHCAQTKEGMVWS